MGNNNFTKSCFNYTGSKYKLLPTLIKEFDFKNNRIEYFIEPFCGGLNVSLNVDCKNIISNDNDPYIIKLYKILQFLPTGELQKFTVDYIHKYNLNQSLDKKIYEKIRNDFNTSKNVLLLPILSAISFSNTIRYNSKKEFNVSFGKRFITENWLRRYTDFIEKLKSKNIMFLNKSFKDVEHFFKYLDKEKMLVYLDPPYYVSSANYNYNWTETKEINLYKFLDELNENGIKFVLTNVLSNKGDTNTILEKYMEDKNFKILKLNSDFRNSIKGSKLKENYVKSDEILIKNF